MKRVCPLVFLVFCLMAATSCKKNASPAVGAAPAGEAATSGPAAFQEAHERMTQNGRQVVVPLEGVKDEASAREAAPQLRKAAAGLGQAMKDVKTSAAALELAGRKAEITDYLTKYAAQPDQDAMSKLQPAIEHAVASPQGPLLREEINAILDALLDGATIRQRAAFEKWIQEKNLRR